MTKRTDPAADPGLPSKGERRRAHLALAFENLENDISDLNDMVFLVADSIERALGDNHAGITGDREAYYLPDVQKNALIFGVYHLAKMIRELRSAFYAELEKKEEDE